DIYEVERVVGHKRIEGSGLYYCLKWKGYSNDENTWEHETSVFCDVYVNEYWRRYEKAGGSRDDALGEDPEFRRMKRLAKAKQSSKRNQDALLPDLSPLLEQSSTNSWEDHVDKIETVEQRPSDRGDLVVHLRWKAGQLTEHASQEIHKRCPLKLLEYYERHLLFVQEG
ncbi:hypothetical protein BC939DRAFT_378061, partial [Gamsiella multidivaricata]|uniref:uncharacterized protein n=1 Tax=Gamsiella multidivaricata TaxID=101098 RepID=UPI00221F6DEC